MRSAYGVSHLIGAINRPKVGRFLARIESNKMRHAINRSSRYCFLLSSGEGFIVACFNLGVLEISTLISIPSRMA